MAIVSVVIPCYNHGRYLREAVESVLQQTHQYFEIIIVNDGSTDIHTKEVLVGIQHPKIRVIHQDNRGLPAARNTGIRVATGEFIIPLDADDRIDSMYLEKCLKFFETYPTTGFVYTGMQYFGDRREVQLDSYNFYKLLFWNFLNSTACYRKRDWEKVGGYDEMNKIFTQYGYEDWEFWIRLGENRVYGKLIPEPLFFYRKHGSSMLSRAEEHYGELRREIQRIHSPLFEKDSLQKIATQWDYSGWVVNIDRVSRYSSFFCFFYAKLLKEDLTNWRSWMQHPLISFKKVIPRLVKSKFFP